MAAFGISSSYTKKSAAAAAGGGDGRTGRAERLEKRQDGVRTSVGDSGDKRLKQTTMTTSGDIKLVILLNLVVSVLISLLKLLISVKN